MLAGGRNPSDGSTAEPAALTVAVRQAARFDRSSVSISAGLLAAIPVVAVLGGGIAAGDPVAAVTMGAGAMLVGIAWRTGGGRPPLALMATDALVMSLSTFVGCVTGSVGWLHLCLVVVWALMAGLLVAVGNRGAVVGNQAIIAFVVFGRFSQPALPALGLAGLVLAGGAAQVLFLYVVRWPPPLRARRAATAAAYRALAKLAIDAPQVSALPAATALDAAEAALSSLTLFGDSAVMTLRSLVDEGYRIRVALSALHALVRQHESFAEHLRPASRELVERVLALTAEALDLTARAIEGDRRAAAQLSERVAELSSLADAHPVGPRTLAPPPAARLAGSAVVQMSRRVSALAGQLRAVCNLATAAGEGGGLRSRRPHRRTNRPLERLRSDRDQIRANASLDSPAGRHALRLAVVVLIAALISRQLPLSRSYWIVVAAATVLRPEFGATFTRGTERALGTGLGVALAGAITVGFHPAGGVTVVLVGLLAWAGYATFPASFAVGFGFITALVVFLLNVVSPDTLATASARLLDTLVGATLGLLAYALWPTWSAQPALQSLAVLVEAVRDYSAQVLAALIDGRRAPSGDMRRLARRARLERTSAEATVARSLSEPTTRRIDAERSQGALAAMHRLIQAVHVLRLDAEEDRHRDPLPVLRPLAADIDALLETVDAALEGDAREGALPDLRASYEAFEEAAPRHSESAALLAELDEIVDAANGLAELVGVGPVDTAREPAPP
ncbi:MAG TPA: FUSC family protein [Solirubrobacteraceae bacterium]